MPRTPNAIGHLDADCFYVSAERMRDSFLVGKPVGVLGNQGACVIAKSYEMKAAGVKTGTPIWEALKLCPAGVYVKRDFRWYEVLSRLMLDAVRQFSPAVEYYSIDEFFFEALPHRGLSLRQTAEAMRDHVLRAVGVPVTVGIARTRTLAKLVSDAAKPFGASALTDADAERALLGRLPVTDITGVARRRAARLTPFGIRTCLDLASADRALVKKLLTVAGEALWWELNGDPVVPLHTDRPPHKMLARGGSLGGATDDPDRLYAWVARNVERLVEELEYHVVRAGALSVHVQHKDGVEGGAAEGAACPDRPLRPVAGGGQRLLPSGVAAGTAGDLHARRGVGPAAARRLPARPLRPAGRQGPRRRRGQAEGQRPAGAVQGPQRGDAAAVRRVPGRGPGLRHLRRAGEDLLLRGGPCSRALPWL